MRHRTIWTLVSAAVSLSLAVAPAPADAQRWERQPRDPQRNLERVPNLEVQSQTKEFVTWSQEIVIYAPRVLTFRWGPPGSTPAARWELYQGEVSPANRIGAGGIPAAPDPAAQQWFRVDLKGRIPTSPLLNTYVYHVRVIPQGGDLPRSETVKITYRRDTSETRFSDLGLHPELQFPMRVKVHLQNFHIVDADETGDEPYIIPMVLWIDGTTIDPANIPTSSVRVDGASRQEVHGNLPTSNDQGSGTSISIPSTVGHFERDIRLIGLDIINRCNPSDMESCLVDMQELMGSTTVWVLVIAFEQDETPDDVVNDTRHRVVDAFEEQVNRCITELTFGDLLTMLRNGLSEDVLSDPTPGKSFCGFTSTEDATVLDQIRAKMKGLAKDEVVEGTFLNIVTFLHGVGGAYALHQALGADDVIGFAFETFTFNEIARAAGAIPFELRFFKQNNNDDVAAGVNPVEYEIQGIVSRCRQVPGQSICETVDEPLYE